MAGIVFFMLIGRWLQDRTYRTISFDRDYRSFFPIAVNVLRDGHAVITPIEKIAVNDHIKLHHGELIPADGILIRGKAEIDYSFVTGESIPVAVGPGELIYAGGKQTGEIIEVRAVKETSQSYLTQLWNRQGKKSEEPTYRSFIDGLSRYFTYIVFGIGAVAAAYWMYQGEPQLMWNAVTTILIVACPCALLLSANFTRGNMLRILSREKLYLRHADVLEKMAGMDTIVFDKTGTITRKDDIDIRYEGKRLDAKTKTQLAAVLANSTHPLSLAVYHSLGIRSHAATTDIKITPGKGIEGWIDDRYIRIGSPVFTGMTSHDADGSAVCIVIDQQPVGIFYVHNTYRTGIFNMLRSLSNHYRIAILSGDNDTEAARLRSELGSACELQFFQKPGDKLHYIESLQAAGRQVMMVGDGLNDAAALKQSNVGIAITEDDNNFTPAADGILHASGVAKLERMMRYAKSGRSIIMTSFVLSILYNIIGLYFAVQGILSPVIAAILMPISSVSIILLTYSMSGWLWRQQKQRPR
jgi:Cu+-exporting ATPase